jgi:hypothetical protein
MSGSVTTNCLSRSLNSASALRSVWTARPRVICSTLSNITLTD